MLPKIN